jgi:hypothetical protein
MYEKKEEKGEIKEKEGEGNEIEKETKWTFAHIFFVDNNEQTTCTEQRKGKLHYKIIKNNVIGVVHDLLRI